MKNISGPVLSIFLLMTGVPVLASSQVECIKYVKGEFPYPSVAEAAKTCSGAVNVECIQYIKGEFPYPTVADAAQTCNGGVTVECIKYVRSEFPFPGVNDAAKQCVTQNCVPKS